MTAVVALLAATTAHASLQEDRDASVRQVCADEGTRLYTTAHPDAPATTLPRGTFVRLLAQESHPAGLFLKVSTIEGQVGYVAGSEHNLCYGTFAERRICENAGSVAAFSAPANQRPLEGALVAGDRFRYFGVTEGDFTLIRYAQGGQWHEAWIQRTRVCDLEPEPADTEVPLRRVCASRGAIMYTEPRAGASSIPLAHGSFVTLVQPAADGGEYLEISAQGQRGYLRTSAHGLCYVTYGQRRACQPAGSPGAVPARWVPSDESDVAATLQPGHRLRYYGFAASGHAYVKYRHSGSWKVGWVPAGNICHIPPGSDRSAGARLLELFHAGSVELADTTSGRRDGADPLSNVIAAAEGQPARRSVHRSSPGGTTYLQNGLLLALAALVLDYGMALDISHIAGGEHSSASYHYQGRAVDIRAVNGRGIWGVSAEATALRRACVALGAVEALGPDNDADHQDHVHCAW